MSSLNGGGRPRKPRKPRTTPARKSGAVPDIFAPQLEAYRLRSKGMEWSEIAGLTGYPSGTSCKMAVQAWLQQAALTESEEERQLAFAEEISRLNRLQMEWWDEATSGKNLDAAKFVLQVIAYRSKLRNLEKPVTERDTGQVLVIAGSEEEYVSKLKAIAEAS